jgi:hypothetical protein
MMWTALSVAQVLSFLCMGVICWAFYAYRDWWF